MISIPQTLTVNVNTDQETNGVIGELMQHPVFLDAFTIDEPDRPESALNDQGEYRLALSLIGANGTADHGTHLPSYPQRTDVVKVVFSPGTHRPTRAPFSPLTLPDHNNLKVSGTGLYSGVRLGRSSKVTFPTEASPTFRVEGLEPVARKDQFKPSISSTVSKTYNLLEGEKIPLFTHGHTETFDVNGDSVEIKYEAHPLFRDHIEAELKSYSDELRVKYTEMTKDGSIHLVYIPEGGHRFRFKNTHYRERGSTGDWLPMTADMMTGAYAYTEMSDAMKDEGIAPWDALSSLDSGWHIFKRRPVENYSITKLPVAISTHDDQYEYAPFYDLMGTTILHNNVSPCDIAVESEPLSDEDLFIITGGLTSSELDEIFGEDLEDPFKWHHIVIQGFAGYSRSVTWPYMTVQPQLILEGSGSSTIIDMSSVSDGPARFPDKDMHECDSFSSILVTNLHAIGLRACYDVSDALLQLDFGTVSARLCSDVSIACGVTFDRCRLGCGGNRFPLRGAASNCTFSTCLINCGVSSFSLMGHTRISSVWGRDLTAVDSYISLFPESNSFHNCTIDVGINIISSDGFVGTPYVFDMCTLKSCAIYAGSSGSTFSATSLLFPGRFKPDGWTGRTWDDIGTKVTRTVAAPQLLSAEAINTPPAHVLEIVPDLALDSSYVPEMYKYPYGMSPAGYGGSTETLRDLNGNSFSQQPDSGQPVVVPRGCLSVVPVSAKFSSVVPNRHFRLGIVSYGSRSWSEPSFALISTLDAGYFSPGERVVFSFSGTYVIDFIESIHDGYEVKCFVDDISVSCTVDVDKRTIAFDVPVAATAGVVELEYATGFTVTVNLPSRPEVSISSVHIDGGWDALVDGLSRGELPPITVTLNNDTKSGAIPTTGWKLYLHDVYCDGIERYLEEDENLEEGESGDCEVKEYEHSECTDSVDVDPVEMSTVNGDPMSSVTLVASGWSVSPITYPRDICRDEYCQSSFSYVSVCNSYENPREMYFTVRHDDLPPMGFQYPS